MAARPTAFPGETIPLINGVARGDIDLVMEIWTANPAQAWVEAPRPPARRSPLGTTFPDASEGWFVPTVIVCGPEAVAPGPQVGRRPPEVQGPVRRPGGARQGPLLQLPGRLAVRGGELARSSRPTASPTASPISARAPARRSTSPPRPAALRSKPALFYYWGPTWLLGKYDFTRLEEPPFDKATWDAMMATDAARPRRPPTRSARSSSAPTRTSPRRRRSSPSSSTPTARPAPRRRRCSPICARTRRAPTTRRSHFLKTSDDWTRGSRPRSRLGSRRRSARVAMNCRAAARHGAAVPQERGPDVPRSRHADRRRGRSRSSTGWWSAHGAFFEAVADAILAVLVPIEQTLRDAPPLVVLVAVGADRLRGEPAVVLVARPGGCSAG